MTNRWICIVLLALGGLGCRPASDEIVLEFWALGREGEVVQALLPGFEAQHPGIRVEVQQIPFSAAHEKLLTAYAGDATPDLFQLFSTWVPEFVALDALAPLDARLADAGLAPDAFFPGIWSTCVLDGTLYGLPWYVDTRLLFYRQDLLREVGLTAPPQTWAAWREAMRRIKAHVGPENYAILLPTNEWEPVVLLALAQEARMLKDGGRYGHFDSPRFREAFTFYVDLFREGLAPTMTNTQISNVWQEFDRGFFAFYITGPWNIGEFRRRLPAARQAIWMTAPMPAPEEPGPGTSMAGGAALAVFRDSAHPEAAWQLIRYLTAPEQQVRFHELTGNLPARRAAWEAPVLADNVYAHAFFEQLGHVAPPPQVPEWERIAQTIRLYAEQVVTGRLTIDQALPALDREVDHLLEKRRWMMARHQE